MLFTPKNGDVRAFVRFLQGIGFTVTKTADNDYSRVVATLVSTSAPRNVSYEWSFPRGHSKSDVRDRERRVATAYQFVLNDFLHTLSGNGASDGLYPDMTVTREVLLRVNYADLDRNVFPNIMTAVDNHIAGTRHLGVTSAFPKDVTSISADERTTAMTKWLVARNDPFIMAELSDIIDTESAATDAWYLCEPPTVESATVSHIAARVRSTSVELDLYVQCALSYRCIATRRTHAHNPRRSDFTDRSGAEAKCSCTPEVPMFVHSWEHACACDTWTKADLVTSAVRSNRLLVGQRYWWRNAEHQHKINERLEYFKGANARLLMYKELGTSIAETEFLKGSEFLITHAGMFWYGRVSHVNNQGYRQEVIVEYARSLGDVKALWNYRPYSHMRVEEFLDKVEDAQERLSIAENFDLFAPKNSRY